MANEVEILWYKKWLLANLFTFHQCITINAYYKLLQFAVGDSESLIKGSCDKIYSRITERSSNMYVIDRF